MTTVIRTRMPLETLSMSQQAGGRRRSKRLAAYDEEDGDFVFTRGPKRTKTAPSEPIPETAPIITAAPTAKRGRKPRERDHDEEPTAGKKPKGRTTNLSTPKADLDAISVPKRRKSTRSSTGKGLNGESTVQTTAPVNQTEDFDSVDMLGQQTFVNEPQNSFLDANKNSTIITLPFSDTPKIDRNKELRKNGNGMRRSSLGNRGRRASSLIENGHSAIPHREVETSDFYKHIEADVPEPRRMKQLLTWTAERAMGGKPSHGKDSGAELAARVIKEQLLKDFGNKSEFSDWFNREESAPTKIIKKPNPRNVEMENMLVGLESRVKLLKEERDQWKSLSKPQPTLPPILPTGTTVIQPSHIDISLLDPEQASILAFVTDNPASSLRSHVQRRIQALQSTLEFDVDQFADGVHKLEQYQETVSRVADKILALSAVRLEEREKKEKEVVGTRDLPMQEVLRSLSRILPEGGGGSARR